ncbi:MAG: hypothetical protein ACKOA6_06375, partial [Actinomycetota bacterium]
MNATVAAVLGGMVPPDDVLAPGRRTAFVTEDGRLTSEVREDFRRIPAVRNAVSVFSTYLQTMALIVIAVVVGPWVWLPVFVLMGRAHAQFASLMHEAAHRLLFPNKRLNDMVGRWF